MIIIVVVLRMGMMIRLVAVLTFDGDLFRSVLSLEGCIACLVAKGKNDEA